jgi:hypothetical protein
MTKKDDIKHYYILCKDTELEVAASSKEEAMEIATLHMEKFEYVEEVTDIYEQAEVN